MVPIEPSEVERVFREAGALRDGHFILSSGKHSPRYLEKFQVLQHPRDTERLAAAIAEWARTSEVETVAGPTTGGIILAHEVARQLGARAIYAERREARSGREFRRGFGKPDQGSICGNGLAFPVAGGYGNAGKAEHFSRGSRS